MSSKVRTKMAKRVSSMQIGTRSRAPQLQRTAFRDTDDAKKTVLHGCNEFPENAPYVPDDPNPGHNFAHVPVLSSNLVTIQPKLRINEPGDRFEQEADRVAEEIMRVRVPLIRRKPV